MRSESVRQLLFQNGLEAHGMMRYSYGPRVNILFPFETGCQVLKPEAKLLLCPAPC